MNPGSSETGKAGAGPSGGLIYNDELMESLATIILLGSKPSAKTSETLPHLKKMLYDYDIYMLSFLSDEDIEELVKTIKENGVNGTAVTDRKLKEKITAIRDNARVFVAIATAYNSVRAYIDKACADRESGMVTLEETFTGAGSEYKLKLVGSAACKKFLKQL
jgi:3-methyladenine DNA glycosylase Tag